MQSITVKCKEIRARNANIVVEGENRAEVVEFTVMDAASIEGLSDMSFYVQYRNRLGEVGMDVLEKDVIGDNVVLDWLPSASFTKERGPVEIQIIGFTQSLVTTSDSTYQSGKLYFDADGEFIPVYPAGSTSSPKVGDSITGTVKEMEETGDDHRWSTMKALLFLPEDVFEGGTPVYTEAQVNALITQIQGEIGLARGYAEAAASSASDASDSEDAAEGSASDAYDSALISEGYAVGTQMGVDVGSDSIYYENNAKYWSGEASDSATAASASAGAASTSATIADNARIASVTETESQDDGGTNVITFTYKDGTTKTFTVKNGKTGSPFEIYKTYASIAAMNADFDNVPLMKMVCISSNTQDPDNGKLYVRGEEQFEYITDMSGAQGIQGPSGTITVGTVTSGATASVTNTGTSTDAIFDFVLPKGDKGDTATIAIGTVTAGDDPSDASVTNVGTSTDAVLDFVLPKGDKGDTGATPLLSIGEVTYGDTPDVTIDVTDPENPVLDFVLKTSEVGVVDNLSSSSSVDALSARMGKDLQNQIINVNSEIDTLDAIVGCEAEVDNIDPSEGQSILSSSRLIHHVNLLPSGGFGLVGARDIKWNNILPNGNFASQGDWTISASASSIADNVLTVTTYSNSSTDIQQQLSNVPVGHKMLYLATIESSIAYSNYRLGFDANLTNIALAQGVNRIMGIRDVPSGAYGQIFYLCARNLGQEATLKFSNVAVRDLTAIFGSGNEPTSVANVPAWMLSYTPYDAGSIVNLNPTGFSIRGINLWDGEMEGGSINVTTGENSPSSTTSRSVNYIPIRPNVGYYAQADYANDIVALFYDMDKNLITNVNGSYNFIVTGQGSFTSPQNAMYMRFYTGNNHLGNIQIADNSLPSSVKTVYHAYNGQTVPVSISGHYVNENVYDYVTNKVVDGVLRGEVHTRVGIKTFDGSDDEGWQWTNSDPSQWPTRCFIDDSSSWSDTMPLLSNRYSRLSQSDVSPTADSCIIVSDNRYFTVVDSAHMTDLATWKAYLALNPLVIYYELATESVTYGEPLRSFSLTDYATVEPITPQTLPNRVDVPFSVLSKSNNGLIEQIRTNTADIADNKAILSQHEARLSNLEQIAGEYAQADLQDYSTVPTGKASFALVETLKGVSRVENQQMPNAYMDFATYTFDSDSTFYDHDCYTSLSIPLISGHVYLLGVNVTRSISTNNEISVVGWTSAISGNASVTVPNGSPNGRYFALKTASADGNITRISLNNYSGKRGYNASDSIGYADFTITDLTLYFNNGTIPTLAEIQSKYPELLEPRAYNAGEIVDATYTSVTSRGVNLFNKANAELGYKYNAGTGAKESSTGAMVTGLIEVKAGSTIYTERPSVSPGNYSFVCWYDIDGTYIDRSDASSNPTREVTLPANARYVALTMYRTGTSLHEVTAEDLDAISINYSDPSINGNIYPYFTATLTIPTVTLKGAGSVSDTLDVESGEITRNVKEIVCNSDTNWQTNGGIFYISLDDGVVLPINKDPNIIVQDYEVVGTRNIASFSDKTCSVIAGTSAIGIRDDSYSSTSDFTTAMVGKKIVYELATPTTDSVSPTLDNTIKTEGGGTVFTDADVDGQFTMGFLNL